MEKMKLSKKKVLKNVAPFVLGAIPGAAAVASMIKAYNLGIQTQIEMRNANIINTQIDWSRGYFANVCDYIRAGYLGDEETMDELRPKVYGLLSGRDEYQTELEILGPEAKEAMKAELAGIEERAMADTMKDLNVASKEDYYNVMINNAELYKQTYEQNVLKNTDIAEANFENSDYMTSLQDSIPTVGEYFDVAHASDAAWNWGATWAAVALGTGCAVKLVGDAIYKHQVNKTNKMLDEKSL